MTPVEYFLMAWALIALGSIAASFNTLASSVRDIAQMWRADYETRQRYREHFRGRGDH
jgi:hypothetical protein